MNQKHFHVETTPLITDAQLKDYMNHMSLEEGMDLVNVSVVHRPINENVCTWHFIWSYAKDRKPTGKRK